MSTVKYDVEYKSDWIENHPLYADDAILKSKMKDTYAKLARFSSSKMGIKKLAVKVSHNDKTYSVYYEKVA